jgi:hypothetical protein
MIVTYQVIAVVMLVVVSVIVDSRNEQVKGYSRRYTTGQGLRGLLDGEYTFLFTTQLHLYRSNDILTYALSNKLFFYFLFRQDDNSFRRAFSKFNLI